MTPLVSRLGEEGMLGYICLADAALSATARRRFAPRFTGADLVRYVSEVRIGSDTHT
jgi:hypothetical protein